MSDVTSSNENNPLEISFKADLKEATDSEPDLLPKPRSKTFTVKQPGGLVCICCTAGNQTRWVSIG